MKQNISSNSNEFREIKTGNSKRLRKLNATGATQKVLET